jgi:hypothetical protein
MHILHEVSVILTCALSNTTCAMPENSSLANLKFVVLHYSWLLLYVHESVNAPHRTVKYPTVDLCVLLMSNTVASVLHASASD